MDKIQEILAKMKTMSDAADFDPAGVDYVALQTSLTKEKSIKASKDALEVERRALAKAIEDNKPALDNLPGNVPVPARGDTGLVKDANADERAKLSMVEKYIAKGMIGLGGVEADTLAVPRSSERFDKADIMLPKSMVKSILHGVSKAWPSDSLASQDATGYATDSNARKLYPPTQWMPEVIHEPYRASILPSLVRRIPAALGYVTYPKLDQTAGNFGGVTAAWSAATSAAERTPPVQTEAAFSEWSRQTYRLALIAELTNPTIRRTQAAGLAVESMLSELFMGAINYELGKRIEHGLAASFQPTGFLNEAGVTEVDRVKSGEVCYSDLVNLILESPDMFQTNGRFILCTSAKRSLRGALDTLMRPLFVTDTLAGLGTNLAGVPFHTENFVVANSTEATATGKAIDTALIKVGDRGDVVYADLNFYGLGIEQDFALARSDQEKFRYDTIVFRLIGYAGGGLMVPRAVSVLGANQIA